MSRDTLDSTPMNEDVFTKPPPYGRITDWLGPEMLQRLLDFAQKQRDSFF